MGNSREWSRRDFLKAAGGSALAVSLLYVSIPSLQREKGVALGASLNATTEWPVIWLQTGSCSGCSVSVLDSLSPRIQNILVDEVVPGNHLSLRYHPTVMAGSGDSAILGMKTTALEYKGGYLLVVEGAISTDDNGVYCQIGREDGEEVTGLEWTRRLGRDAAAVIALGTCAVSGGIPAAGPNPTGCFGVQRVFNDDEITTPVINIPGCPPHPDWFVGTIATILVGGLGAVDLDDQRRPTAFFSELIHHNCPRYSYFERGQFSTKFSDPYCMYQLGCKGPITHADCPKRMWNSGTSWCVGANSLCHGCAEPGFPDFADMAEVSSSIRKKPEQWEVTPLAQQEEKEGTSPIVAGVVGGVAGAVIGAAAVAGGLYAVSKAKGGAESQEEKREQ